MFLWCKTPLQAEETSKEVIFHKDYVVDLFHKVVSWSLSSISSQSYFLAITIPCDYSSLCAELHIFIFELLQFLLAQFQGLSRYSGLNLFREFDFWSPGCLWTPPEGTPEFKVYILCQGIYLCYENYITWKTEKRPSWNIFYNISLRRDVISFLHNLGEKFRLPIWLIFPIFCSLTWTP